MSKFKVGDRVRVIANEYGHEFDIGEVVTIIKVCPDDYQAESDDGDAWWVIASELLPVPQVNTLTPGQTYTSANGNKWECIFVRDGKAWLVGVFDGNAEGSAYDFDVDGTASWVMEYDRAAYSIVFEPVRETVYTHNSIWNGGKFKYKVSVDMVDGTPDWSTAKVTPCD